MKHSKNIRLLLVAAVALAAGVVNANTRFVKQGGSGDGSSWANASGDVQLMINASAAGDEVWVAAGTYKPTIKAGDGSSDRDKAFMLKADVKIYGGFNATNPETSIADRDWVTNTTILSGDLGTAGDNSDNAYHVVIASYWEYGVNAALLDGFTITGGNSNGGANSSISISMVGGLTEVYRDSGGGLYFNETLPTPTLTNLIISGNSANDYGGGLFSRYASPKLTNVTISGNKAAKGAGIGNYASSPVLTNVTIAGNKGYGLYSSFSGTSKLFNTIVWGNTNNIYKSMGNNITYQNSLVQGLDPAGTGNLAGTADPKFVSPALASAAPTNSGDYRLSDTSPCIGQGDNTSYLTARGIPNFDGEKDLAGRPRKIGANIDMGAYEEQTPPTPTPDDSGTLYVKTGGTGDGSSWANAYPNLADPLQQADKQSKGTIPAAASDTIRQIWVAAGTYYPMYIAGTSPQDRNKAFVLVNNVKIYGGFPANANDIDNTTITDRDWATNITTLSGDIDGNDLLDAGNVNHVVISAGDVGTALLDGFTITGGSATDTRVVSVNKQSIYGDQGGGIEIQGSSPTLTNLVVSGNRASYYGGGIYNRGAPTLINVTISGNSGNYGAGIYNDGTSTLTNVTISGNSGNYGAGIFNNRNSTLTNVIISGNSATSRGGGIYNEGYTITMKNSIVAENTSSNGPDIWVYNDNSTFVNASYSLIGNMAQSGGKTATLITGNITGIDPQFVGSGDYSLQETSRAVNAGDNSTYITAIEAATGAPFGGWADEKDLAGNPRLTGTNIDMGAYENQTIVPTPNAFGILHVKTGGTGDGSSWANAYPNLAEPLRQADRQRKNTITAAASDTIRQIWVAAGTYYPMYKAGDFTDLTEDSDKAFVLANNVKIYGGFPADANDTDNTTISDRDWATNMTTLSGDIDGNGTLTDNAYHVVVSVGAVGTALLDGFTITGGNANGSTSNTINGISIIRLAGGGIYSQNSSPTLIHVTISGNTAGFGGGIHLQNSSTTLTNVTISGNSVTADGGGINNSSSSPTLTNVTISGNTSSRNGSGIYLQNSSPTLTNTIVWGNTGGNNIEISSGTPIYNHSLVEGLNPGGTNLDGTNASNDPQFANASTGDYLINSESPVANAGDNAAYIAAIEAATGTSFGGWEAEKDIAGNPRLYNVTIDMGAYEVQTKPAVPTPDASGILFVKDGGAGAMDGSSWANAHPNLADPLRQADKQRKSMITVAASDTIRQIWVAAGTYYPMYMAGTGSEDSDKAFVLVEDVKIYGGFEGSETSIDERDWATNVTTLSGDIDNNGTLDEGNTNHVVVSAGDVGTAQLDGFTITGGNARAGYSISVNGQSVDASFGGGIINVSSSPALRNVIIIGNKANYGGGIHNMSSSPTLTNATISGNTLITGGASGGGIYNDNSSPTLTNVTISGNIGDYGGGIYNVNSSPVLNNSIVWGNNGYSENIYDSGADNTPTYNYSLVEDLTLTGNGNLDGTDSANNPLFTNADAGDYSLNLRSPAVNAGDNAAYITATEAATGSSFGGWAAEKDLAGNPRLEGASIDMGAYEVQTIPNVLDWVGQDDNGMVDKNWNQTVKNWKVYDDAQSLVNGDKAFVSDLDCVNFGYRQSNPNSTPIMVAAEGVEPFDIAFSGADNWSFAEGGGKISTKRMTLGVYFNDPFPLSMDNPFSGVIDMTKIDTDFKQIIIDGGTLKVKELSPAFVSNGLASVNALTLRGTNANQATLSVEQGDYVFDSEGTDKNRLTVYMTEHAKIELAAGATWTVKNAAVLGDLGATIYNSGNLTLTGGTFNFIDNITDQDGGAIYNDGGTFNLNVTGGKTATFSGNKAMSYRLNSIHNTGHLTVNTAEGAVVDMLDPMAGEGVSSAATITKSGAGTWKLAGENDLNTSLGTNFTVSAGTLDLYKKGDVGDFGATKIKLGAGIFTLTDTLVTHAVAADHASQISASTVNSTGGVLAFDLSGVVDITGSSTNNLTLEATTFTGVPTIDLRNINDLQSNRVYNLVNTGNSDIATGWAAASLTCNGLAISNFPELVGKLSLQATGIYVQLAVGKLGAKVLDWVGQDEAGNANANWNQAVKNWTKYDASQELVNGDNTFAFGNDYANFGWRASNAGSTPIRVAEADIMPSGMAFSGVNNWTFIDNAIAGDILTLGGTYTSSLPAINAGTPFSGTVDMTAIETAFDQITINSGTLQVRGLSSGFVDAGLKNGLSLTGNSTNEAMLLVLTGNYVFDSEVSGSKTDKNRLTFANTDRVTIAQGDGKWTVKNTTDNLGGAIYNDGTVDLFNVDFTGNAALTNGGAIYNGGTLNLTNVDFIDNSAVTNGGAIATAAGSTINLNVIDGKTVTFSGNTQGSGTLNSIYNTGNLHVNTANDATLDMLDPMAGEGVSGRAAITKNDIGTWKLAGDNDLSTGLGSNFTVNAGTLFLYGSEALAGVGKIELGAGKFSLEQDATLDGEGQLSGAELTIRSLSNTAGSIDFPVLNFNLPANTINGSKVLDLTAEVDLTGVTVNVTAGEFTPLSEGESIILLESPAGVTHFTTRNITLNNVDYSLEIDPTEKQLRLFNTLIDQTITWNQTFEVVYGDAPITLTATASSGLTVSFDSDDTSVATVSGDQLTIVGAGTAKITASQAGNATYNAVTDTVRVVTVNPKSVTITDFSASDKEYDGNAYATILGTATIDGKVAGDDLDVIAGSATFDDKNVGTNKTVTFTSCSLDGAAAKNYTLAAQPASVQANITPAPVTITPYAGQNKYYNKPDPAAFTFKANGQVSGEIPHYSGALSRIAGDSVWTYNITQGDLAFVDNGAFLANNYTLEFDAVPVVFTINVRVTDFMVEDIPSYIYTGSAITPPTPVVKDDDVTLLIAGTDYTASFSDNTDAGAAKVTITGINGYAGNVHNTIFIIEPKLVSITGLVASDKEYDGNPKATAFGIVDIDGKVKHDDLSVVTGFATFADKNAGTGKTVTFEDYRLGGTAAGNYTLEAQPASVQADISAKPLTISGLSATNKTYDGTVNAPVFGSATIDGKVEGDNVILVAGSATFNNKNIGPGKTVTFTGYSLDGTDATNYSLSQPANGTATITAKSVTITGLSVENKPYDGNADATVSGTATLSDNYDGDDLTVTAGSATFNNKNVGPGKNVTFKNYRLDGPEADNYTLLTQPLSTTANITAKSVTITGLSVENKTYDGNDNATILGTATIDGKVAGDDLNVVTGLAVFADKNAGTAKTVTFEDYDLSGSAVGNYTLSAQPANVTANITAKAVTITPDAGQSKYYGANDPVFTFTENGQVSGEIPDYSGALTRVAGETVGPYNITPGNLAFIDNGAFLADNYTLAFDAVPVVFTINTLNTTFMIDDIPSQTYTGSAITPTPVVRDNGTLLTENTDYTVSYSNNTGAGVAKVTITGIDHYAGNEDDKTFIIEPKLVTITGLSVNSKEYDGNANATILGTATIDGKVAGDDLNVVTGLAVFADKNAGTAKTVTFEDYDLSGSAVGNYTLASQPANVQANITAKAVTITPNAGQSKYYGANDPVFTFEANGQLAGEIPDYSGTLARITGETAGTYNITQGNLAFIDNGAFLADNYTLTFDAVPVVFTIIENPSTGVKTVTINGTGLTDNFYVVDCGATEAVVTITTEESNAQVVYNGVTGNTFSVDISRADIYTIEYTVISGTDNRENYSLQIERYFAFEDITGEKFNNVLFVNNNPDTNDGYHFTAYEWFKNGQSIGTGQYYSAGDTGTDLLDPTAQYSVTLTTDDGKVLHTCVGYVTLRSASLKVYPNPATAGEAVTIEYDAFRNSANDMVFLYNLSGQQLGTQKLSAGKINLPNKPGTYVIQLNNESVKVIVK